MNVQDISGVAVDLGGTKISVTRFEEGDVTEHKQVATNPEASSDEHIESIAELLEFVKTKSTDSVGVAVCGRVDSSGNWHAVNRGTIKQVSCVAISELISTRVGREIIVLNDTFAAAIGEAHLGAGFGSDRFAYITISTGVGGTCVIDGKPLQSNNGLAGHAGFVTSRFGKTLCGSGRYGTVESISSGRAIALAASTQGYGGLTAKHVFIEHVKGARWATDIITLSASAVADLIANLAAIAGIDRAVIGGSIGLADGYCELLRSELENEPNLFVPEITIAALGQHSVSLGVLLAQIRKIENS